MQYVQFEGNNLNIQFPTTSWGAEINRIKSHFFEKDGGVLWQRNCPVWGDLIADFRVVSRDEAFALIFG